MTRGSLWPALALSGIALAAPSGARAFERNTVCDETELRLEVASTAASPTFSVDDSGRVRSIPLQGRAPTITNATGALAFQVNVLGGSLTESVIVRVELADPSSSDRGESLGCMEVAHGAVITLRAPPPARGRRVLRISVFRSPRGQDEERRFAVNRAARIAALETEDAGSMFAAAQLRDLLTVDLIDQLDRREYAALVSSLETLTGDLQTLSRRLECRSEPSDVAPHDGASDDGAPPDGTPSDGTSLNPEPFRNAQCAMRDEVAGQLGLTTPTVRSLVDAPPTSAAAAAQSAEHAAARQGLLAIRAAAMQHLAAGLDQLCSTAANLRWLRTPDAPRLATVLELPWTSEAVEIVEWDEGIRRVDTLRDATIGGVIVHDVPLSQRELTFRQTTGNATTGSLATALARFGGLLTRRLGSLDEDASTNMCRGYSGIRIDGEVAPLARVGTRAYVVRNFPQDHVTKIDMCAGDACSDSTSRGSLHITPRRGVEFAALLEAGVDFLPVQLSGTAAPSFTYTQPHYVAVGGNQGPEQVYVLDDEVRVGRIFTLSALLGITFPLGSTRGLAALGVVLFDGEGERSFTEGLLRFGVEVSRHVFLTIGTSVTVLERDRDPGQRDTVLVPRTAGPGSTPAAPPLELDDALVVSATLGLAIDLAAFGEAADSIVKAVGGSS